MRKQNKSKLVEETVDVGYCSGCHRKDWIIRFQKRWLCPRCLVAPLPVQTIEEALLWPGPTGNFARMAEEEESLGFD